MESFMDWKLIYRTPEQMGVLSDHLPGDAWESHRLVWDAHGTISFLDVVKRGGAGRTSRAARAVRAAGIEGKSAHGLRKVGATRAAENGATVAELEAIFGWRGGRMASLYTEAANRARLSRQAMGKLANETGSDSPSPNEKVRDSKRKRK